MQKLLLKLLYNYGQVEEQEILRIYQPEKPVFLANPHGKIPHILFAIFLVETMKPSAIVELGTYSGNSFFAFCQVVKDLQLQTKCFAVDTCQGDIHVRSYDNEVFKGSMRSMKDLSVIMLFEILVENILLERVKTLFKEEVLKLRRKTAQLNKQLVEKKKEIKGLKSKI